MEYIHNIDLENILKSIVSEKIESWTTEPIDNTQRYQIHKFVESYNSNTNNQIDSLTSKIPGIQGKKIIKIYKKKIQEANNLEKKITKQTDNLSTNLSVEMIELFIKYSKLPIPTNSPDYLEYYLNLYKEYYNTSQYKLYIDDIKTLGYQRIKSDITKVKNEIIKLIKSNEKYNNFLLDNKLVPAYPENFIGKNLIYNNNFIGKNLISIDIKSANWTCLKRICSGFIVNDNNIDLWENLVGLYSPSKFLAKSKYLREVIFGELNSKKITKFIGEMLYEFENQIINTNPILKNNLTRVVCNTDEIIYEIQQPGLFDFEYFIKQAKKIDPKLTIYRIEKFSLNKLNPYDYFIKQIFNSNEQNVFPHQIKQVPKHFVCQIIKFNNKEPIEEPDLKFMFENIICTFDKPLEFIYNT